MVDPLMVAHLHEVAAIYRAFPTADVEVKVKQDGNRIAYQVTVPPHVPRVPPHRPVKPSLAVDPSSLVISLEGAARLAGISVHALRHARQRAQLPHDVWIVRGRRVMVHRERFTKAITRGR
jgi:hypothetical protein